MIKAILFDSGGVVINHKLLVKKLIKIFKPENKEKFWNHVNIAVIPLCKNKISEELFWKNFAIWISGREKRKNEKQRPRTNAARKTRRIFACLFLNTVNFIAQNLIRVVAYSKSYAEGV